MASLPFYARFMRTPAIVSFAVAATVLFFASVAVFRMEGYWGGFFGLPMLALFAFGSLVIRGKLRTKLVRRSMWKWGKDKFSTWDEFSEWLALTPFYKLNKLAETPDDEWIPAKGGGVMLNTKLCESKNG
jgi:hypothetical protein